MVIDRIEEAYPELNPRTMDYDEPRLPKVLKGSKKGLMATGDSPSAALYRKPSKAGDGRPKTAKGAHCDRG